MLAETKYVAGAEIYGEGEDSDAIYVIQDGLVEVSRRDDGRPVRLGVIGKGEIFGETGVILDQPRSTSMIALSDAVLLKVTKKQFFEIFGNNPIGLPLLRMLCNRLDRMNRKLLESQHQTPVPARLYEIASIRLLPGSELTARQIGEEGVTISITSLPFRVGQMRSQKGVAAMSSSALSLPMSNDSSLSPDHFAMEKRDGILIVHDLGSYLGTIANDQHLSRYGHTATANLTFGANEVIAGTEKSPYRFRILVDRSQPAAAE